MGWMESRGWMGSLVVRVSLALRADQSPGCAGWRDQKASKDDAEIRVSLEVLVDRASTASLD